MVTEKREMFTLQFTTKTSLKVLIIFGSKLRLLKKEKGLHYNLCTTKTSMPFQYFWTCRLLKRSTRGKVSFKSKIEITP